VQGPHTSPHRSHDNVGPKQPPSLWQVNPDSTGSMRVYAATPHFQDAGSAADERLRVEYANETGTGSPSTPVRSRCVQATAAALLGDRLTATQPLLVDAPDCVVLDRLVRFGSLRSPSAISRRFSFLLVWRLEMIRSRAKRLRAKPRRLLSLRSAAISFGTNQAVTLWLALARSASGT
jgi:hypothetical protein